MGEIYKITNKINGKVYIGQTKYTTEVRWESHMREFYRDNDMVLYRALLVFIHPIYKCTHFVCPWTFI